MGRVLWVHSSFYETETYRDVLAERGYSVDGARNAVEALPKLDNPYDIIFFSPYCLSWGDAKRDFPDGVDRRDSLDLGLWFYDRIKESRNSRTPLFLVPIGIIRLEESKKRVQERMNRDSSIVHLCDLTETLPNGLCNLIRETLNESGGVLLF